VVPVAAEILKKAGVYDRNRLFGVSTLDIVRAQTFIGELKARDPTSVKVHVVGGHSPETMLPILSHVNGISFTAEEETKLVTRIQEAGTEVVNAKEGAGSATLSMAYAASRFVHSVIAAMNGKTGIVEDTYIQVDGMEVAYFGMSVELGPHGISKIHNLPPMNASEQERMMKAMPILKQNIETGISFVNST